MGDRDTVLIRVLEESPDSSVFVVQIQCQDPVLLAFWLQKSFFHNGQVQQTDTLVRRDGAGLEFVLRVLHRSERLSNAHYWSPFVVTLCLDALLFHYHLLTQIHRPGSIQQAMKENTLTLTRSQSAEREEVEGRAEREEVEKKEKREEGKERFEGL